MTKQAKILTDARAKRLEDALMSGWRPIDTAPKDGRDLLLYDGRIFTGSWMSTGNWYDYTACYECVRDPCVRPTHWQPLPAPPNEKGPLP